MSSEPNSGSDELTQQTMPRRQFLVGAGATAAAVAGGAGGAMAASDNWETVKTGLNFGSGYVPGPYFAEDGLEKEKHKLVWGTDDAALVAYEDDSGEKASLPGVVDCEDTENVVTLRADRLEAPDLYEFPRGESYDSDGDGDDDSNVYALDPTHWTTTGATNGSISVASGSSPVAHSLHVSTSSVASGETVSAEFTDVSVTSDPEKRYLQGVVNANSLTSGVVVTLAFIDEDGDRKELTIDPSGDASTAGVIAATTAQGIVFQQRAGDLPTVANGDGTWSGTETVRIEVSEADADVEFTALNAEKMSTWGFGSYLKNEDTDDETRVERTRPSGEFTVTSLDTLDEALTVEDAVFYRVKIPVRYPLAETTEEIRYKFEEATDRPGYDYILTLEADQVVPNAYDLTHNGPVFEEVVSMPSGRYIDVKTASGVGNVEFGEVGDNAWTSHGSAFDSEGATVQFASTIQPGTIWRTRHRVLLTSSNRDEAEGSAGGGGAVAENSGGGGGGLFGLRGSPDGYRWRARRPQVRGVILVAETDAAADEDALTVGYADAWAPILFVGIAVVAAPLVGSTAVVGGVVGVAAVGAVTVLESCYRTALAGVDWARTAGPSNFADDNRASHKTTLTAGAGAGGVAMAAATMVDNHSLVYLVKNFGIGGTIAQVFLSIIGMIQGAGETFMAPLEAFGSGLARVVAGVFPARIVNAAADFTAFSLTEGDWNFFGPATFAVGVIATLAGIWVFMQFLRRTDLSAFGALFSRR
jgi:hypothetical protein